MSAGTKKSTDATSKEMVRPVDDLSTQDAQRTEVISALGRHGIWWWAIFIRTKTWAALLPWPVHYVLRLVPVQYLSDVESSAWATLTIPISAYLIHHLGVIPSRDAKLAFECAKLLVSGAFLIGTILSVSVAMPGQALMKVILKKNPQFALEFVVPFMWGFMWSLTGAAALLCFYSEYVLLWFRPVAVCLAVYGACMLVHAITHTVRMYLLGLMMISAEADD